jgi:hypothetical protein
MRNVIIAGATGLFLAFGAVNAQAAPQNSQQIPPDGAYEAIMSAMPLIEGRAAYEDRSPYGGLAGNQLANPQVNYGAPASASDFVGSENTIRR